MIFRSAAIGDAERDAVPRFAVGRYVEGLTRLADLQAPECSQWREMAPERVYDAYPITGDACFALRTLMVRDRIVISSLSDYDEHRKATGIKRGTKSLLTWALIFGGIYVFVWVNTRIVAKVAELRSRKS